MMGIDIKTKIKIMINIDRAYYILVAMILAGILLTILFTIIYKRLFQIPTWQNIKRVLEAFRSFTV